MQQQTFQLQQNVYTLLWNIIQDVIKHFRKGKKTPYDLKLLKKAKQRKHKLSRTYEIMKKRQNIETRGFDTNAYVSYKQSLNKKQTATIISQIRADKNKDAPEPGEDDIYAAVE